MSLHLFVIICRHLLFAPSSAASLEGATFPGLVDLLAVVEEADDPDTMWKEIKRYLSVVTFTIHAAADTLTSSPSNSFEI